MDPTLKPCRKRKKGVFELHEQPRGGTKISYGTRRNGGEKEDAEENIGWKPGKTSSTNCLKRAK